MDITKELEDIFFNAEDPVDIEPSEGSIDLYINIVRTYAQIDGAIVVLSDLINHKSYICVGFLGARFGLEVDINNISKIDSIWEELIFTKIHPADLFKRHILELKFFHFLKNTPSKEHSKYSTDSRIRMLNIENEYQYINHRTLYLGDLSDGNLRLALCIYRASMSQTQIEGINGKIIDNQRGLIVEHQRYDDCSAILSSREKEILFHIEKGYLSKEIAGILNISFNTVNRHRQNILKRLGASNSFEAIKMAQAMDLL